MATASKARHYALALTWFILFPVALFAAATAIGNLGVTLEILFLLVLAWVVPPLLLIRRARPPAQRE